LIACGARSSDSSGLPSLVQARPDPTERLRTTSRRTRKRVRGKPPRVQIPPPPPAVCEVLSPTDARLGGALCTLLYPGRTRMSNVHAWPSSTAPTIGSANCPSSSNRSGLRGRAAQGWGGHPQVAATSGGRRTLIPSPTSWWAEPPVMIWRALEGVSLSTWSRLRL